MGMSLCCPQVTPMGMHGGWSIGAPWKCLMCNTMGSTPCGFYGIGWGLIIGNPMALFYGPCIGIPWTCIGAAHGEIHGSALWLSHWEVYMGLPWNCIGNAP